MEKVALISIIIGVVLAIPYGFGAWLKWQVMKSGTIIPVGSIPQQHGSILSLVSKGICLVVLILIYPSVGLWVIAAAVVMYFLGGWVATLIERKFYCDDLRLDTIVYYAEENVKDLGANRTAELLGEVAPKWWIKLMPMQWQKELHNRLSPILLPGGDSVGKEEI